MRAEELAKQIIGGSKQALAKGITLICSHLSSDQQKAGAFAKGVVAM